MEQGMINWPVTIEGILGMAIRSDTQYEFRCSDPVAIGTTLPLVPGNGNPYVVTVAQNPPRRVRVAQGIKARRNRGIQITCRYGKHSVVGQFHRKPDNISIWIGSNYTFGRAPALNAWKDFVRRFGVVYGVKHEHIAVWLEFHTQPDLLVVIHTTPPGQMAHEPH